jgi:hypothetical protein
MRKALEIGGIVAAAILIVFGVASIVISMQGQSTINSSLKQQQIYGTPDMSPKAIQPELKAAQAQQAALFAKLDAAGVKFNGQKPIPATISAPSCTVASQLVDDGTKARCFANYMWIHTMGTNPLTYSQMGRYEALATAPFKATDGLGGTNDVNYAKIDPKTQGPVDNARRDLWVTYTALTTALNTSYMASQISMFGIVVGVALLLAGIGFGILALGGALRNPETSLGFVKKWTHKETGEPAAPAA